MRRELEEAHSERAAAEGERAQFEVDRQRFEEEMGETRRQHQNQILAFEIKMEQVRVFVLFRKDGSPTLRVPAHL